MDPLGFPWILVENLIFWAVLLYIAIQKRQTPIWLYSFLLVYIVYLGLRFMFSKQGMEFAVLWYTANAIGLMAILYSVM